MTSDEEKKGAGKGFSGISSLVSDVDNIVTSAKRKAARSAADAAGTQTPGKTAEPVVTEEPKADRQSDKPGWAQPSGGSSARNWLLAVGVGILILWLFSMGSGGKSNTSAPRNVTTSPERTPLPAPTRADGWEVVGTAPPQNEPVQVPSRPAEDRPPVGTNIVLDSAQIRYCLSEQIRIDAARTAVNNYIEAHVDRFNTMVADYNSRCGQYRYRRGSVESARADVERYRTVLEAEGRRRITR